MAGTYLLVILMYVCSLSLHVSVLIALDCGDVFVGMQNGVIPDDKITASSGTAGDQARLNYTNGPSWCAMEIDTNPYLQIDLGTPHIICAVSTQGNHQGHQWVETFYLSSSNDGKSYKYYSENKEDNYVFYGNVDGYGIVKQILYTRIVARYLRIRPKTHHRAVCMRTEIYGVRIQSENLAFNKVAVQSSTSNNGSAFRAVDGNRDGRWLANSCTHCRRTIINEWWRVDLGNSVEVADVSVFTRSHPKWGLRLWNTTFQLLIGHTPSSSTSNPLCGGEYGIIPAGSITIVCNPTRNGRYVFIMQKEKDQRLSLCEVEVYGQVNYALRKPVKGSSQHLTVFGAAGVAVDGIRDVYAYKNCTSINNDSPWLMVDLGQSVVVSKVHIFTYYDDVFWYDIHIGNNPVNGGTSNQLCGIGGVPIRCQPNKRGRFLTIMYKEAYKPNKPLSICEVEVYVQDLSCVRQAIGLSSKEPLTDIRLQASSEARSAPEARLNGGSSWSPLRSDTKPWLQIDLLGIYYVCAVATQGDPNSDERTTKYKIQWLIGVGNWKTIANKTSNQDMTFTGNRDPTSIIKHIFPSPLMASMIRFCPEEKNQAYALRVEAYGVKMVTALPKPFQIGIKTLQPRQRSFVDLVCKSDKGMNIKWYYNYTDITSYSNGTVISRLGIITSKLRINYTSADDLYDKYSCGEVILQKRNCTSLDFVCQVDYGSYRKHQARGNIVTELSLPKTPTILRINTSLDSATIKWKQPNQTINEGNITSYKIYVGQKYIHIPRSHLTEYTIKEDLKPDTEYTVKMKAVSRIGESEWSNTEIMEMQQSGHKEDKENKLESDKEESMEENKRTSSSVVIAIAIVVPLLIILTITLAVVILWYKRRKSPKKATEVVAKFKDSGVETRSKQEDESRDMECQIISIGEQSPNDNQKQDSFTSTALYCNLQSNESSSDPISVDAFPNYMSHVSRNKYEQLTQEFQQLENGQKFLCTVAKKPINKIKNRYANIIPYDTSRVVLQKLKEEDSDYINASYIWGFDGKNVSYIASQGPVKPTVVDFWQMIWQEKTSVIVMLTCLVEGDKTKCEKYWPENIETYLNLSVKLHKTEIFADYSIRTFFVSKINTAEERYVFQYHFTAWPDKGVPQYATQLLGFRKRLVSDTAMGSPWVVHCSAGVGRTGAFLAIDAMLRQAEKKKTVDISNFVKTMRENRPNMVQTEEQYLFIHLAILEYLTCGITEIRAQQLREEMSKLAKVNKKENLSGFEMEFKHLAMVCPPVQDDEITAGSKPCNNRKNRFPHIVSLDRARVILQVDVEEEEADYINASYANGYRQRDAYILTQAPLDNTIADFWKMIYDKRLGTIVMLNNLQEGNVSYPTYWPSDGSQQFGDITVAIIEEENKNSVILKTFHLTHKSDSANKVHEVRHFQHLDWSDGSVPRTERSVLDLLEKVQRSQQESVNKSLVVQCSDGVGRSGTFCTILSLLERVKTEQMVDVFQTVKALRISRPGAVESAVQYKFCFQLVTSYLESFSDYSNFNG